MDATNPYADFGSILMEGRFIGRRAELRAIGSRVFGAQAFGSVAVLGLPRVGKTSLVSEAIRLAATGAGEQPSVIVRADVGAFDSIDALLRYLVEDLVEKVRCLGLGNELVEKRVNEALARPTIDFNSVRVVFRSLRQASARIVCVLDEFDAGRRVFKDTPEFFHWLRELCSNPEFKAAVVLVAKRRLQDIAQLAGYESNYWSNVLMTLSLKPFSEEDVATFYSRLEKEGIVLEEVERCKVLALTGGHPYLLDVFGYHAWEHVNQGQETSVDWIESVCGRLVQEYHQQVSAILGDGPMLSKIIQVVVGPQWDVTKEDVAALCELGALRDGNGLLRGFSSAFEDYLRVVEHDVDIWPQWRDTERVLRDFLEYNLKTNFGADWPNKLVKARPRIERVIQECRGKRDQEVGRFGIHRAESSLLSYSYPSDLYQIMCTDWVKLGEPLLGRDKQSWAMKFNILSKVRTPLAHNREESVGDGERRQAEGICREILGRYRKLEDSAHDLLK